MITSANVQGAAKMTHQLNVIIRLRLKIIAPNFLDLLSCLAYIFPLTYCFSLKLFYLHCLAAES